MLAHELRRKAWWPTWLQPAAALLVIVVGWVVVRDYPAGQSAEALFVVPVVLVTLPGLVVAVVDAVRTSRASDPLERPAYQRFLDGVAGGGTPRLPASLVADVVARVLLWGAVQVCLSLALMAPLVALPIDDGWGTLAGYPAALAVAVAALLLVAVVVWLAVTVLTIAARPGGTHPLVDTTPAAESATGRRPWQFRTMLAGLGVMLLGLGTFWIPNLVLTFAGGVDVPRLSGVYALDDSVVHGDSGLLVALWALRIAAGMVHGGLACVIVTSPLAWRAMNR